MSFPVELDSSQALTQVVEVVKEEAAGVKLEDARVVVSGGRDWAAPSPSLASKGWPGSSAARSGRRGGG